MDKICQYCKLKYIISKFKIKLKNKELRYKINTYINWKQFVEIESRNILHVVGVRVILATADITVGESNSSDSKVEEHSHVLVSHEQFSEFPTYSNLKVSVSEFEENSFSDRLESQLKKVQSSSKPSGLHSPIFCPFNLIFETLSSAFSRPFLNTSMETKYNFPG